MFLLLLLGSGFRLSLLLVTWLLLLSQNPLEDCLACLTTMVPSIYTCPKELLGLLFTRTALLLQTLPELHLTLAVFGSKSKEQLIIKSKNDMDVDLSPRTSDLINIRIDCIALGTEHLPRNELDRKLQNSVSSNSIVLLTSPAGSGKSSLFKLFKAATPNSKVVGIPFDERTAFEQLCDEGIYFKNREISEKFKGKNVVVFLDDAQTKYSEVSFWEALGKKGNYTRKYQIHYFCYSFFVWRKRKPC